LGLAKVPGWTEVPALVSARAAGALAVEAAEAEAEVEAKEVEAKAAEAEVEAEAEAATLACAIPAVASCTRYENVRMPSSHTDTDPRTLPAPGYVSIGCVVGITCIGSRRTSSGTAKPSGGCGATLVSAYITQF
jgi:hypothetical protein